MKTHFVLARLTAIVVFASVLSACGQRGPLYMPGTKPPKSSAAAKQKVPVPQSAPEPAKPDTSSSVKP